VGSLIEGFVHGHGGRGLCPPGWGRCYQLAVVLTLAAAPRAGSLAAARGVWPAHQRPVIIPAGAGAASAFVAVCTAKPGVLPIRTLLTTVSAPAMVRN